MEHIKNNLRKGLYALLIAGMIGSVSACDSSKKNTDTSSSTNTGRAYDGGTDAETMDVDKNSWMRERDTYVSTHRDRITKIDRTIEEREKEMKNMSGKTKSAMNESINSLKMKRDRFEDKLNEMEQSTEENWTRMRNELDESATELDRTYDAFDKEYSIKR
jgi:hypothetical protein